MKQPANMASRASARELLIEDLYEAATEPSSWQVFLDRLVEVTGSRSARMLVMNSDATMVDSSIKVNIDDGFHRQYVDHYVNTCPWRPELRLMAPGRLYSTFLDFSCKQPDFYRTEFFNDWARPQDIHHGVCGTVLQDREQTVQLLVQRTRGQGFYDKDETDFFNSLVSHLQRSFLIARQIAAASVRSEAIVTAAGQVALPFLLFDSTERAAWCSRTAESVIGRKPGLSLRDGRLRIGNDMLDMRFRRLLRACLTASRERSFHTAGDIMALPPADGTGLRLLVTPVHPDLPDPVAGLSAHAAVYIHDAQARVDLDCVRLGTLYALSAAECRVAAAFVNDARLDGVAQSCGIGLSTVRTHLKSIFSKTGTRGQTDLMRLLLTGPTRR